MIDLPPPEVIEAAETVRVWMEQNGHRNWQFGGLCDRRVADERDNAITDAKQFEVDCIRALHERNEAREQRDVALEKIRKLAEALAGAHEIQESLYKQRDALTAALSQWPRLREWLEMDPFIQGYMSAELSAFDALSAVVDSHDRHALIGTTWCPKNRPRDSWKCTDVFHSLNGRTAVQLEKYQGGRNSPAIITTKTLKRNFQLHQPCPTTTATDKA